MRSKINKWKRSKIVLILFLSSFFSLSSQQIEKIEPNYGLAVTGTGMTVCVIGTTMRQSAIPQYTGRYGTTHIGYNSFGNRTIRLSTMAVGAVITLTGILLQNRKRKKSA